MTDRENKSNPLWCDKHDYFKRSCPWCEIEQLEQEREKLIEGLRFFADRRNHPPFLVYDNSVKAREILKSIGIDV